MREWDSRGRKGTEWESNIREIFIKTASMGLGRKLVLGKFTRIHNNDLS